MPNVTMAFDEGVRGWTSEFTFVPDSGLSLNNSYYTFLNGRVYRHNSSIEDRNTFYGISDNTVLEFVFNENPTVVKNYKSLNYEGSTGWDTELSTNMENGTISSTNYIEKQGEKYAWIRGEDNQYEPDLSSSNVSGIGLVDTIDGTDTYNFADNIPPQANVGDFAYRVESSSGTFTGDPVLVGIIESKTINSITITQTGLVGDPITLDAVVGDFMMYVKDNITEKSGIIGYYNIVTMTNESVEDVELFSVNANQHITTV